MQRGDTPGTLELTVNVPADAHVMDFKFLNEDVASPQTRYDSNNGADYHAPVTGGSGAAPKLNVVHIAVEMAPICKVGGMGDVVTALARATQEDGHNVEVIVPHYDCMLFDAVDGYHRAGSCVHHDVQVDVFKGWVEDVPVTLLRPKNGHFDVGCIYGRHDDHVRFGFFTEAALTWMRSKNKEVDIIHAHDWQTAPATWGNYPKAATALTLHNLQFGVDLIRRGMESCDIATTVSPTYADEVRSHHAVAPSQDKFVGIRNGIDTDIWNPSADEFLPLVYDSSNAIAGKAAAAAELCRRLGIQHPEGAPIVGVVSRLTAQKGIHLIKHACHRALERGATFVLLGSAPDPAHQHEFNALADEMKRKYPGRSGFMFKYDEPLSHLIYAGCDFLLVPSMFEPCGLTQMIAMRYGTVPVVRRTGGLRDTVFDVENDGERSAMTGVPLNGFVFDGTETPDIDYALNRALDAFYDRPRWQSLNLVERTLNLDWSWFEPAKRYEDLYWASLRHKRGR
jgi:starch synthase